MRANFGLWAAALCGIYLSGCSVFGGRPTPLPWVPTAVPVATAAPQVLPTATLTGDTPGGETPAPTRTLPTASPEVAVTAPLSSPQPTVTPTTTPMSPVPATAGPATQVLTLDIPIANAVVGNPLAVRGSALHYPFEGTLVIRVYDARGQLAAEVPILAQGEYGTMASFAEAIPYGGVPGPGRVEVLEFSPRDGSVSAMAVQAVTLSGYPGAGYVEIPSPLSKVTLPIGVMARVGVPGQQVRVSVVWDSGARSSSTHTLLQGLDGRGLLAVSLDAGSSTSPHPDTQLGAIEIKTLEGSPLAWQPVWVLGPQDPGTMPVRVYWLRDGELVPSTLRVPRTLGIGRAALERLLWGPSPGNVDGFTSAIPSPAGVLSYPGRDAAWGERVSLRQLTITNGVARADFSIELNAHAGGAEQVVHIRQQIEATLRQFATVNSVIITVNGQPALLEP